MSPQALVLLCVTIGSALACVKPLGEYMFRVGALGEPRAMNAVERRMYAMAGVHPQIEMDWKQYARALLTFNLCGVLLLYAIQRLQAWLPLNPQKLAAIAPQSAFNTAVSFVTNTDWQSYAGESAMSYATQMCGLTVQNFLSASTGLTVAFALIRGFVRHGAGTIGNFWVDLLRSTLYVLLPLAVVLAIALASQGVLQNLHAYQTVTPLEPTMHARTQELPMGPVASQEAIKQLGTNGGGFFNANSAHPFENPTALSNLLEMIAMILIPMALTFTFGRASGDTRQGWAVLAAMILLLLAAAAVTIHAEQRGNPRIGALGVDQSTSQLQSGGNMEGKETRFGIAASALFATLTTATSTGATNAAHDSLSPLGGLVTLVDMQLGEVIPGGVGTGLYSILMFAIVGVFIAGLMIGRTPEYLGKKIEAYEMKMASVAILIMPILVLVGTAFAVSMNGGTQPLGNPGPHGFSEALYAFSSAANNNGSAFAGLGADTTFYDTLLGVVMWIGRFWPIVAVLAIAGSLAAKKRLTPGAGTLPTHGPTFIVLLIGTILLVGVLTFIPALALGPVIEHLTLWAP